MVEDDAYYTPKVGVRRYEWTLRSLIGVSKAKEKYVNAIPIDIVGCCSFMSYSWMTILIWTIYRKGISCAKLYRCSLMESCKLNTERLEFLWMKHLHERGVSNTSLHSVVQIFLAARLAFTTTLFTVALMLGFLTPVVFIYELTKYVNREDGSVLEGLAYVLAIFVVDFCRMFMFSYHWGHNIRTAVRLRSAMLGMIYKKVLSLNSFREKGACDIINLCANDSTRILEYAMLGHLWIAGVLTTLVTVGFLFWLLGAPAFAALGVFCLFFAAQYGVSKLSGYFRMKAVNQSDKRVQQMTEILNSMKIIKLYAWGELFANKIGVIRRNEKKYLERMIFLRSVTQSFSSTVPVIAAIVTFVICFITGYQVDSIKVFAILGALIMSRSGLMLVPMAAGKSAEFKSTISRIQAIMLLNDTLFVPPKPNDLKYAVCLTDASFSWQSIPREDETKANVNRFKERENLILNSSNRSLTLKNLTLNIKNGSFVGICGEVGGGKSSLISAIMGQMPLVSGGLAVGGSFAYVAQQAWMLNTTVRENVLFGRPLDESRLQEVIECCALDDDLEQLPLGLDSPVGERGGSLSGGQQQRVSLARAVYSNRDIYLLDDPFSAVDHQVGLHIYRKCIRGALKNKTVVLIAHQVRYLLDCDLIVVLQDGRVVEMGSPKQLLSLGGSFSALVDTNSQEQNTCANEAADLGVAINKNENVAVDASKCQYPAMTLLSKITEPIAEESLNWSTFFTYVRHMGGTVVFAVIFLLFGLNYCSSAFSNWWLSHMLTRNVTTSFASNETSGTLAVNLIDVDSPAVYDLYVYLGFLAAIFVTCFLKSWVFVKGALRASTALHNNVLKEVMQCPLRIIESIPIGHTINIFSKDQDEVDNSLSNVLETFLSMLWVNCVSVLMVVLVFPMALVPLSLLVVLFAGITVIFHGSLRNIKRLENDSRSPLFAHINSTVLGISTIHAYDSERRFLETFHEFQDDNSTVIMLYNFATRWVSLRLDLLAVGLNVCTALFVVFSKGVVPPLFAGLAFTYSAQLGGMLHFMVRMFAETQARFTNVERVVRHQKCLADSQPQQKITVSPPPAWPTRGDVAFNHVTVRYSSDRPPALDDVSFRVEACQRVGIVGRTGSGKSSLGLALFRLFELHGQGSITIDDVDVASVDVDTLCSVLSMIPQDPTLFAGTVRFNLDPFNVYTDNDIWEVLRRTKLNKKISKLTGELDAEVSKNGENFSVGERQLLCLARALLRQSRIIFLDEATASVDARTDTLMQDILQEAFARCTVLTIAHRVSTVLDYDVILVMDHGKLIEQGTPAVLLANKNSAFRRMYDLSTSNYCGS